MKEENGTKCDTGRHRLFGVWKQEQAILQWPGKMGREGSVGISHTQE